ncbi:MAG: ATP-binding protein [Prevotella sp.]
MANKIIGREREQKELAELYRTDRPIFTVVYGRRRVGKTYLVRQMFEKIFAFCHTGLSPFELSAEKIADQQLRAFYGSLVQYGSKLNEIPKTWFDAFDELIRLLRNKQSKDKQVIFIDELPWMDTPRSGFLTAFEHFWNGWGAHQDNLMLIVCGSATSWISDKLINNKGGLYNRVTNEIKLMPFTLGECEAFYKSNGIVMSRYEQLQCYMAIGGIPFYMSLLKRGVSLAQNIDMLFFDRSAKLKQEFARLYGSLFTNSDECEKIIRLLATKRQGYTRKEIAEKTGLPDGGGLSSSLKALEVSDFISSYVKYDHPKRMVFYRLVDSFSMFFLSFVEGNKTSDENFWQANIKSQQLTAWRGFSFETLCFYHIRQIKHALGISGVHTESSPWSSKQKNEGAQIDMLIDRADNIINVCEMKFSEDEYTVTSSYDKQLRHKMTVFREETKCRKTLHLTLVTTFGLYFNEYSGSIQNVLTMDDLFKTT